MSKNGKLKSFTVDILDDRSYVCRKEYETKSNNKDKLSYPISYKTVKSSHQSKKDLTEYLLKIL